MKKKLLFVMSRSPHGTSYVQEMLDVMLTAAAFDQEISVLFLDDGVFQLKKGQDPVAVGLKDIMPIFLALEVYDIKEYYAEAESIKERAIDSADLQLPVKLVSRNRLENLMIAHDIVYNS